MAKSADGDAPDVPTVEDWSEKDQKLVVKTTPGSTALADLTLRAKVDATPEEVYAVLTDPASHTIFRGIKATLERRTIEDNGKGRRKLLVSHQAVTRFLWLQVAFSTQLVVEEDDRAHTITFRNARDGGFMRTFTGRWEVQPFSQATLDRIYKPEEAHQSHRPFGWLNPVGALGALQHHVLGGGSPHGASLVTLEQVVTPRVLPPGPLLRMVRGICARTVSGMMDDLQREIERRRTAGGDSPDPKHGGKGGKQQHGAAAQQACLTARALDLLAGAAPLQITLEL